MRKNIVLCGFMGCGKSTVGKLLSQKTDVPFVDLDEYIEQKEGLSISEIFQKYGEEHFRRLERQAAELLALSPGFIISTGGGTLMDEKNVSAFQKSGDIVLLDVPLSVVKERLKGDVTRPLLQRPDKDKAMQALYEARLPLYRAAANVVVNASQTPQIVCGDLIKKLQLCEKN